MADTFLSRCALVENVDSVHLQLPTWALPGSVQGRQPANLPGNGLPHRNQLQRGLGTGRTEPRKEYAKGWGPVRLTISGCLRDAGMNKAPGLPSRNPQSSEDWDLQQIF